MIKFLKEWWELGIIYFVGVVLIVLIGVCVRLDQAEIERKQILILTNGQAIEKLETKTLEDCDRIGQAWIAKGELYNKSAFYTCVRKNK